MYLKGSCILFVYGEGGHAAQMNRLAPFIFDKVGDKIFLSLSDSKLHPSWSSKHFVSGEFRSKSRHSDWLLNKGPIEILKSLLEIRKSYKVVAVISTGPGISLISALFFKVFGAKIIHVETWSRFTTRSFTGKLMYFIADKFYVQHRSLLTLYPNAVYSGVL